MTRLILVYGSIVGIFIATIMVGGIMLAAANPDENAQAGSQLFGYTVMLVAMSLIFVAVKRYRDNQLGGVIKFVPAMLLGFGIAGVASVIYVSVWEIYFNSTGGEWAQTYVDQLRAQQVERGASPEEIETFMAETQAAMELYQHWWFRIPITFTEILPVGLIVALVSAGVLRNPNVLPRRA